MKMIRGRITAFFRVIRPFFQTFLSVLSLPIVIENLLVSSLNMDRHGNDRPGGENEVAAARVANQYFFLLQMGK